MLDIIVDWIYQQIVGLFGELFAMMNGVGVNLFSQLWTKQIVSFFQNIGWALFAAGIIMAVFEFAIASQNGKSDLKTSALNVLKGFMAVNLFAVIPVELYAFSVKMQSSLTWELAGAVDLNSLSLSPANFITPGLKSVSWVDILSIILFGYAVVKVFFGSLKRGGILLVQIAVGSLYMFSIPRGYTDGFTNWVRQIVATCLTSFLQAIMLSAGLILFRQDKLMGLGLMLSATEIPRIAGMFGIETGTRANITGTVYAAQSAVSVSRSIIKAIK